MSSNSGPLVSIQNDFAARSAASKSFQVDAAALAAALRREIRGEVRFDNVSRALYATDG